MGASKEEPGSAQSKGARKADVERRRRGMKQLPDRQEAIEHRPPEGWDPRRVIQRPATQGRGGQALDVEQEPPEARTAKDRTQDAKDRASRAGMETFLRFRGWGEEESE